MVSRAFSKPKNSEELIATGEYMLYASTKFMQDMTQTVRDLSAITCDLSRYTALPKENWIAHAASIRWIRNIKSIFFKYSTSYEALKSQADEILSKTIVTLNYDLDAFAPNLTVFDRFDDIDKLYEYKLVT